MTNRFKDALEDYRKGELFYPADDFNELDVIEWLQDYQVTVKKALSICSDLAESEQFRELVESGELATEGEWELNKAHDLWTEINRGAGLNHKLIADCVTEKDNLFITKAANARKLLKDILNKIEGC